MLYDVLPPLLFFGSLGGIILIVSRVVGRVRREQFSQELQAVGQQAPGSADRLLGSSNRGIRLVKNRLVFVAQTTRRSIDQLKETVSRGRQPSEPAPVTKEYTDSASVKLPASGWRSRIDVFSQGSKRGLFTLREKIVRIKNSLPLGKSPPAQRPSQTATTKHSEIKPVPVPPSGPTVRLVTDSQSPPETSQADQPRSQKNTQAAIPAALSAGNRSRLLKQLLKKERSPKAPLSQAAAAMEQSHYDEAEDILVPYLSRHIRDTQAYMLLGQAAAGKGAWDEAVEIFEQVVKINSDQEGAHAALGRAALRAGKMTLALASLQRARDRAPNDKKILKLLLTIAQRMDNQGLRKSVIEQLAEIERARAL